jgi:hypothetical protein
VVECWDPEPDARPPFVEIVERLEDVLKDLPSHSVFSNEAQQPCCTIS